MKEPKRTKNGSLSFTTPVGESFFAHLIEPDTKFNPDGMFAVNLKMSATDPEAEELKEYIDKEVESVFEDEFNKVNPKNKKKMIRHYPYEMEVDEEGNETGNILFKFSNKAFFEDEKTGKQIDLKPKLFGKTGQPLDTTGINYIGNGSQIQVAGYMKGFMMPATGLTGVSLKINAVLVKELVEGNQSAESYGFDVEEESWNNTEVADGDF
jgi:hypothetical protein